MSLGVGKLPTGSGSSVLPDGAWKGVASDSTEPLGASSPGELESTIKPRSLCSAKGRNKSVPNVHITQLLNGETTGGHEDDQGLEAG